MIRSTAFLLCILAAAQAKLTSRGIVNFLSKTEELSSLVPLVDLPCSNDYNIVVEHALNSSKMAELKKSFTGLSEEEARAKWLNFLNIDCQKTSAYKKDLPECTKKQLERYFPLDNKTVKKLSALKRYIKESQKMAINVLEYGQKDIHEKVSQHPTQYADHCKLMIDLWDVKERKTLKDHFSLYLSSINVIINNIRNHAGNVNEFSIFFGAMKAGLHFMCYRDEPVVYDNFETFTPVLNECHELT